MQSNPKITNWNSLTKLIVVHWKIRPLSWQNASKTRSHENRQNHRPLQQHDCHLHKSNLLIFVTKRSLIKIPSNFKQNWNPSVIKEDLQSQTRRLGRWDDFIDVWHFSRAIRGLFYYNLWRHWWSYSSLDNLAENNRSHLFRSVNCISFTDLVEDSFETELTFSLDVWKSPVPSPVSLRL